MKDPLGFINKGLRYSFFLLFFTIPLVLHPKTFELFEFNKLWLTFSISLVILFLWISRMILEDRVIFKRTPFDIPLGLFLISQIISTVMSIDPHVSFWGYYSRFNGGLLSIITYIFLYYAFVSNFISDSSDLKTISYKQSLKAPLESVSSSSAYKILAISLLSGLVVAVWGFSSHFGYDLTCLVFRGTLDVSCWTDAFQPTIRLFSTLGQPNWLAAYFSILIPIALGLGFFKFLSNHDREQNPLKLRYFSIGEKRKATGYLLLAIFLFIEVLWTQSQSGFLGLLSGLAVFIGGILFLSAKRKSIIKVKSVKNSLKILGGIFVIFVILSFFLGHPLKERIPFSTFEGLKSLTSTNTIPNLTNQKANTEPQVELGGSDSGKIRLVVWQGAIELFKKNPLFGTGVETFAYAYYQVKPLEHNLLSEWDYLYNKAHNEYLNYLATTGIFGFSSYLFFIGLFIFFAVSKIVKSAINIKTSELEESSGSEVFTPLIYLSLLSSFITILISNFLGFSVVVINIYFFLIPALFLGFSMNQTLRTNNNYYVQKPNVLKVTSIVGVGIICLYFEFFLLNSWLADQEYSLGYNLDRAQEYVLASPRLENAVKLNPGEDLYRNELALNLATLGLFLSEQNEGPQSSLFINRAKEMADDVIKRHPQNVVFYKTRIQTYFVLSQLNEKYFEEALMAISKARKLAPTDAKIAYNEGLLYGQKGDHLKAIESLKEAIKLKPNYRDPRYAMSVYLIELSKKETDPQKKQDLIKKAKDNLNYTLKNIAPTDPQAKELLKSVE
jgi:putative inorganic carbon (hco3(-)) transporter